MGQFQVLFSGEVVEGAQEAQVRKNLSLKFGLDDRKVGQLFSGRTVVIESSMEKDNAYLLQKELIDLGAVARVKDLTASVEREQKVDARDYKDDSHHADYTLKDITAAHIECPRCGHLQLDTPSCARCGVDMASASTQKQKEDRRIERQIHELKSGSADAAGNLPGSTPTRSTPTRSTPTRSTPTRSTKSAPRSEARPSRKQRAQATPRRGLLSRLGFGRG